jgi:hypothetical protein
MSTSSARCEIAGRAASSSGRFFGTSARRAGA